MQKPEEAESKRVKPSGGPRKRVERRDATMTGGERMETEQERKERRNKKPPEPPIIQKDVT